jgi:hypothetical protein
MRSTPTKRLTSHGEIKKFVEAARYLGSIDDETVQLEFLEWMLRYTYQARDDHREEYIDRGLDALDNENGRRMAVTIAERLRQEGLSDSKFSSNFCGIFSLISSRSMPSPQNPLNPDFLALPGKAMV